jgi:TM2 domain-containing membrane protein YozV
MDPREGTVSDKKKLVAGLLGIFLGEFGIHKFYLGYNTEGLIMLLVTLLTGGLASVLVWALGIVEGIIYLTKSDDEFRRIYVEDKKGWL